MLKLGGTTSIAAPTFKYTLASSGTRGGAAVLTTVTINASSNVSPTPNAGSTVSVVGYIGNNSGTLTLTGLDGGSAGGTKLVSFDYINADFTMTNTDCPNCRNALVSVNGGTAVAVQFPISGQVSLQYNRLLFCFRLPLCLYHFQSWDIVYFGFTVPLSGFKAGTTNTIVISGTSGYFC